MKNSLKDIHSHILHGIDDGSKSIDDSINILKQAEEDGVTDIILTPHYVYKSTFNCNNISKVNKFKELIEKLKDLDVKLNLYLGNEIYLDENILALLKKGECLSLNNTRYVLVEFPMHNYARNIKDILFQLIRSNYVPIVAHPERYTYFQEDFDLIETFIEMGVLFQGNYKSLFGKYGKSAEKTLTKMLKNDYISFLASDVHKVEEYELDRLYKKLSKIINDEKKVKMILNDNFDKIVKNVEL